MDTIKVPTGIKAPSRQTLKKYGLDLTDWLILVEDSNLVCPICKRRFGEIYGNSKRPLMPVIDHVHIRNFKRMKPEKRRMFVRGLPCNYCNRRRLGRGMDLKIARNIVTYLERYENKKPPSD